MRSLRKTVLLLVPGVLAIAACASPSGRMDGSPSTATATLADPGAAIPLSDEPARVVRGRVGGGAWRGGPGGGPARRWPPGRRAGGVGYGGGRLPGGGGRGL